MIHLLLEGRDFKYPLYNLIRVFFPIQKIIDIKSQRDYLGKDTLIVVSLGEKDTKELEPENSTIHTLAVKTGSKF